jgi:hypothetical protein
VRGERGSKWRGVFAVLGDDRLHVSCELRLVQPDRQPLLQSAQGGQLRVDLHVLVGDGWLRLALADVS